MMIIDDVAQEAPSCFSTFLWSASVPRGLGQWWNSQKGLKGLKGVVVQTLILVLSLPSILYRSVGCCVRFVRPFKPSVCDVAELTGKLASCLEENDNASWRWVNEGVWR